MEPTYYIIFNLYLSTPGLNEIPPHFPYNILLYFLFYKLYGILHIDMDLRITLTLFILLGTIIEIALVWSPNFFTNETLRYIAGIFVVLDVLALLSILMNI